MRARGFAGGISGEIPWLGQLILMLINGHESEQIPVSDRGFQYGDGLFETLAVEHGEPVFLIRHLDRLRHGCKRLAIEFPGHDVLSSEASRICKGAGRAVLKIIVTRGPGGRGFQIPEKARSTRVLSIHPRPDFPVDFQSAGIRAILCRNRLGINSSLAGLKHMNRLEQILARSEWDSPRIQEGLMQDSDGNVIEGTMSNLFLVRNGSLQTPDLSRSGVAGIIRSLVLEIAASIGIAVEIGRIGLDDFEAADEVFVTNSLIGVWPVVEFERFTYAVGPLTR
ncbi:MAG: aminodeoxychorismate lyase, partial [Methylococcaceae bacterium]|nr:aminodeoxychorismate lyase [Methylococcaceae bacterium]